MVESRMVNLIIGARKGKSYKIAIGKWMTQWFNHGSTVYDQGYAEIDQLSVRLGVY